MKQRRPGDICAVCTKVRRCLDAGPGRKDGECVYFRRSEAMACNQETCDREATHVVFWPGRVPPPEMCAEHAAKAERIGGALGVPITARVLRDELDRLASEVRRYQAMRCTTCKYRATSGVDGTSWCCVMPDGCTVAEVERGYGGGRANVLCSVMGGGCLAWEKRDG